MFLEISSSNYTVLEKAYELFGEHDQNRAAMEECAETIVAISHFERGRVDVDQVIAEFADAFVCVAQVIHNAQTSPNNRGLSIAKLEAAINAAFSKLDMKVKKQDRNFVEGRE